jgi:hypothetical protein
MIIQGFSVMLTSSTFLENGHYLGNKYLFSSPSNWNKSLTDSLNLATYWTDVPVAIW